MTTSSGVGFVVFRIDEKGKQKAVSGTFITQEAAQQYAQLCRKQGWDVSVVFIGSGNK